MKISHAALGAVLAACALQDAVAAEKPVATIPVQVRTDAETLPTRVETDGGITVETMDGRASFALDGRLQYDTLFYNGIYNDASGDGASDTRVRRMRLGVGGELDPVWEWYFSIDVANDSGKATLDAGYLIYKGFALADITAGRHKRPFYLEALTSSKWITTVERGLIYDVIRSHVSDFGITASKLYDVGEAGKLSWYAATLNEGVEDYAGGEEPTGRDHWQYYARVAWAPWARKDGALHFGLALGELNPARQSTIDIASRLGVSAASPVSVSYTIDEDREAGLEAAFVLGPFSAQAEYVLRTLDLSAGDSADISGGYAQLTYTLTGESRQYKPYPARMDKVAPSGEHAFGAIELVARYDDIELERPGADAATARTITVGANWYLTPHVLFKLNYLTTKAENFGTANTDGDALTTRLAFVF
jgi:phosphate-selective porin OprO and OprP